LVVSLALLKPFPPELEEIIVGHVNVEGNSMKKVERVIVGGHKMHTFTANIIIFDSRYRRSMLITNEFHEFC
jgi:hypothetical protein